MRWVEMKCKCAVWSVGCEGEVWGQCLLHVALHRDRARVMFLDSSTAKASHKARTHGPGWRTAPASSFVVVLGSGSWKRRWHMRRDEKRWAGIRWEELRWDEVWSVESAVWSVGREECSVKCGVWSVKCGVWRKQWEVRSVKCGLWSVKCEVWSVKKAVRSEKCGVLRVQCEVKCGVRSVQCEVWSGECEVCSVECEDRNEKCEVRSGASNVTCETRHHFRRVHARTGLAGARRIQVL